MQKGKNHFVFPKEPFKERFFKERLFSKMRWHLMLFSEFSLVKSSHFDIITLLFRMRMIFPHTGFIMGSGGPVESSLVWKWLPLDSLQHFKDNLQWTFFACKVLLMWTFSVKNIFVLIIKVILYWLQGLLEEPLKFMETFHCTKGPLHWKKHI